MSYRKGRILIERYLHSKSPWPAALYNVGSGSCGSAAQIADNFLDLYILQTATSSQMLLIRFCCRCSLNTKLHSSTMQKCAMTKAITGHSAPKSGVAMAR